MKNSKYVFVTVLIFTANSLWAQSTYVKLQSGYAIGTNQENFYSFDNTGENTLNKTHPYSMGQGFNYGVEFGHVFSQGFGIEAGISFLNGSEMSTTDKWSEGEIDIYTLKSKATNVNFSLLYQIDNDRFKPYAKLGLLASSAVLTTSYSSENSQFSSDYSSSEERSNGIQLGFCSGVGVSYAFNDRISVFGEGISNLISFKPTTSETKAYTYDGEDMLSSMTVSEKETIYKDEIDWADEDYDPDKPSPAISELWAMSSFSFNLGIKITL